jgi:hypothetical protein
VGVDAQLPPQQLELLTFEVVNRHPVPAIGAADEGRKVELGALCQRIGGLVEYPQTVPNLTASSTNLYELTKGRNLIAYADANIRLAMSRSIPVETPRGWKVAKEKASHKIDVVVALAMAALGRSRRNGAHYNISARALRDAQSRRVSPWKW